jgi:hypothetical protein
MFRDVIVAGRMILKDRKLLTLDERRFMQRLTPSAEKSEGDENERRETAGTKEPGIPVKPENRTISKTAIPMGAKTDAGKKHSNRSSRRLS